MAVIASLVWMASVSGSPAKAATPPVTAPVLVRVQPVTFDGNDLYVAVVMRRYPVPDPNRGLKTSAQLENAARARLARAKFHVMTRLNEVAVKQATVRKVDLTDTPPSPPITTPVLRVALNVGFLETGSRVALHVQTSIARSVRVVDMQDGGLLSTNIWSTEPVMQSVPATRWEEEARKLVLQQVEAFIMAARPPVAVETMAPPTPASSYVAFRLSSEFHWPDYPVARTIKPENLVIYKTRGEALVVGKRPCRSCRP